MELRESASRLLQRSLGPGVAFRPGQWEAIHAIVEQRSRLLVVQKTGWGKSVVYFVATKLLRERGAGTTLIVSPLLSLMRDQARMANRLGLRAARLDSANTAEWDLVEAALHADEIDLLLVSPERLANERFRRRVLPSMPTGIGLLVVDEAHCISDWGHDFRPDYRRIVQIVGQLPTSVPVLATTATANDRVVADVEDQLGPDLSTLRGSLARPTLRLQAIRLDRPAERLAWLAAHIPDMPSSGIVYCLTIADTEQVAAWLRTRDIDAVAYHSGLPNQARTELEERLLRNKVKALVSTVALGMGFDKPDLGFVIHYQRPGSVVAYYQQIGRAGRAGSDAFAILLSGAEDDKIHDYFVRSAFPTVAEQQRIVAIVEASSGIKPRALEARVNMPRGRIEQALKLLEIDGAIARESDGHLVRTFNPWQPDLEQAGRVSSLRRTELERMRAFVSTPSCLMEFVTRDLDDPTATPCGRCANCVGDLLDTSANPRLTTEAERFLASAMHPIQPRRWLPDGVLPDRPRPIATEHRCHPGHALCVYGDAGWGALVRSGKYTEQRFGDELVDAAALLVQERWQPRPAPRWVTSVPSLRLPSLTADFARRLASVLGLPYMDALKKVRETPEQKTMENSAQQFSNIVGAMRAIPSRVPRHEPVLLIDDIVDSGWTLTVCGGCLRKAGSGPVFPLALAKMPPRGDQR